MKVIISITKKTRHSFLVALIPALPLPEGLKQTKTMTEYAVIAANDENGNQIFSYVHLEADEKEAIGRKLMDAGVGINKWFWCELFTIHPTKH